MAVDVDERAEGDVYELCEDDPLGYSHDCRIAILPGRARSTDQLRGGQWSPEADSASKRYATRDYSEICRSRRSLSRCPQWLFLYPGHHDTNFGRKRCDRRISA